MAQPNAIKIVLLGSSGVGKSSILNQYINKRFDEDIPVTLGASFFHEVISYRGSSYKFQIWDTAGQEKYSPLARMYYKDAHAAILVYDSTDKKSFSNLKQWHTELNEKGPKDIKLAIVGNKSELLDEQEISEKEGKKYASKHKAIFKATSASENKGICELFESILDEIIGNSYFDPSEINMSKLYQASKELSIEQNKCCL